MQPAVRERNARHTPSTSILSATRPVNSAEGANEEDDIFDQLVAKHQISLQR